MDNPIYQQLRGTGVALVTPFQPDGQVDFPALAKLLAHTGPHVDYWVLHGTTGEPVTTTPDEKAAICALVRAHNPRQLPLVYGLGGNHTAQLVQALRETDLSGFCAVLSVSPYYNKPSQEGIYRHYLALADASPLPLLLYNVPGRTGANLSAATTLRLAQHPNIVGIKEAAGDLAQAMRIAKGKPADFLLISGDDLLTLPMMSFGAVGAISVLANAFPRDFAGMVRAALAGDFAGAARLLYQFTEINDLMYAEGNPVGLKVALAALGVAGATVRPPHAEASEGLRQAIEAQMAGLQ
jgi:4-hydroxy-tetrahydrodipicolinate synthase